MDFLSSLVNNIKNLFSIPTTKSIPGSQIQAAQNQLKSSSSSTNYYDSINRQLDALQAQISPAYNQAVSNANLIHTYLASNQAPSSNLATFRPSSSGSSSSPSNYSSGGSSSGGSFSNSIPSYMPSQGQQVASMMNNPQLINSILSRLPSYIPQAQNPSPLSYSNPYSSILQNSQQRRLQNEVSISGSPLTNYAV